MIEASSRTSRPEPTRPRMRPAIVALFAAVALSACGGGGGGSSPPPSPPPPPAPTLAVAADTTAVVAGGGATPMHATLTGASATPAWSLVGPGSLSAASGTDVNYLPPDGESAEGTATVTVTAAGLTKTLTLTLASSDVAGHHWDVVRGAATSWLAAGYADGTFVATGSSGGISSSPDGVHWTAHDTSTAHTWHALGRGPSNWVAVSDDGSVANSPDGTTWTVTPNALLPSLGIAGFPSMAVAYGNGTYVASLADEYGSGATWASTDGVHWNSFFGTVPGFSSVAFGNGIFVGVSYHGLFESTDGSHWTPQAGMAWSPQNPYFTYWPPEVFYANGTFDVIVFGQTAYHSDDGGKTWVVDPMPTSWLSNPVFDGKTFYQARFPDADPTTPTLVRTSSDFRTWIDSTMPNSGGYLMAVARSPSTTVVFSNNGAISTGTDLSTLAPAPVLDESYGFMNGVMQSGGTVVIVSDFQVSVGPIDSPRSWHDLCAGASPTFEGFAGDTTLVDSTGAFLVGGVAYDSAQENPFGAACSSKDGTTWSWEVIPGSTGIIHGMVDDGRRVVAADTWGGVFARARDGSWSQLSTGSLAPGAHSMAYGGGHYVVVGSSGLASTSTDGVTWTNAPPVTDGNTPSTKLGLWSVVYDGTRFVAVGDGGSVVTSADGSTWSVAPSAVSSRLLGIARSSGGELVAVGADGVVQTSVDAAHWTLRPSGVTRDLKAVSASATGFIAVGYDGVIVKSTH